MKIRGYEVVKCPYECLACPYWVANFEDEDDENLYCFVDEKPYICNFEEKQKREEV